MTPERKIARPTIGTPQTDENSGAIVATAPSTSSRMPICFAESRTENRILLDLEPPAEAGLTRTIERTTMTHATKAGRNDTCPCGSGKKYKKCCELKLQKSRGNTCCWSSSAC